MAVYRITNNEFEPLAETSFETEKLYERYDLRRMLHDRPTFWKRGCSSSLKSTTIGRSATAASTSWPWTGKDGWWLWSSSAATRTV